MKEEQVAHIAFVQMVLSSPQVATGCVNAANQTIKQCVPPKADVCMGGGRGKANAEKKQEEQQLPQTNNTHADTHTNPRLAVTLASQQHWS